MSTLGVEIKDFVVGDDLEVRRQISSLPAAILTAWMTIKESPSDADNDAILQKIITTADVPGTGHIEDDGAGGTGTIRFDFTFTNTTTLGSTRYVHDIQIRLTTGKIYTVEKGSIRLAEDVTKATT